MRSARVLAFASLVAVLLLLVRTDDARACGGFAAPRRATEGELARSLPFLTVEQVLIVWDEETGTEDFIRETRFERADEAFGFVVPVPTKPEVAGVGAPPFDKLRERFPYTELSDLAFGGLSGAGGGSGKGAGEMAPEPPVVVLSQQRIGNFTAFTLSATDAGAFDKWLGDNGFAMTAESKPWLEHYVALKFFFTAFRYEPKPKSPAAVQPGEPAKMTSQTVRIRFKTPLPYYPYLEPAHGPSDERPSERMLTGWLVTREPMAPVAARRGAATRWARPWNLGIPRDASAADVRAVVGADLAKVIPNAKTPLVVHPFRDLKVSREGFGDVLMVPQDEVTRQARATIGGKLGYGSGYRPPSEAGIPSAKPLSEADIAARRFLLPVIDPELLEGLPATKWGSALQPKAPELRAASMAAPSATSPLKGPLASGTTSPRAISCSAALVGGAAASSPAALLALGAAILAVRRRRSGAVGALFAAGLLVAATGCRRAPPIAAAEGADAGAPTTLASVASSPDGDVSLDASAPTPSREERERAALAILSGEIPAEGMGHSEQPSARYAAVSPEKTSALRGEVRVGEPRFEKGTSSDAPRVMAALRARFRACFNAALGSDPKLSGNLTLRVVIGPTGEVTSVNPAKNQGLSTALVSCVTRTMQRATFSPPEPPERGATLLEEITFERIEPADGGSQPR